MAFDANRKTRRQQLRAAELWVLKARLDLPLIIATPLLVLPAVLALQGGMSIGEISIAVAAFGALGHHLPGMMRAYGDPELFARFRTRFIAGPVLLVGICWLFRGFGLEGIALILLLWGLWHGLAQVYGFERIYDGKVQSRGPWTQRLDLGMCVAWFGAGFLHSPNRIALLLTTFYDAGGPLLPAPAFSAFLSFWFAGTAAVTVIFAAHLAWCWSKGKPQSPAKILLMISSFAFWWFAMNGIDSTILGVAMFEIFHDIQYLTIVWVFNRRRVEEDSQLSPFMRFTFRPRGWLIGVYVGSVLAYGSLGLVPQVISSQTFIDILLSLVAASTLLHFYFDGFIWKVRESSTAKRLGLESTDPLATRTRRLDGLRHAAAWCLLIIPLGLAGFAQLRGGVGPEFERLRSVATLAPGDANAHYNVAVAYGKRGQPLSAIEGYERTLAIDPSYARARINLGMMRHAIGDARGAVADLELAVSENSEETAAAQNSLAWILATTTNSEVRDPGAAVRLAEAASERNPNDPRVADTLAVAYAAAGRFEHAIAVAEKARGEALGQENRELSLKIDDRLRLFRARQTYQE